MKNGPQARQIDYMVQYDGKLYIYGGEGGKKYLNDFWSYDIGKLPNFLLITILLQTIKKI